MVAIHASIHINKHGARRHALFPHPTIHDPDPVYIIWLYWRGIVASNPSGIDPIGRSAASTLVANAMFPWLSSGRRHAMSSISAQGVVERASAELTKRINGLGLRTGRHHSARGSVMERVTNVFCGGGGNNPPVTAPEKPSRLLPGRGSKTASVNVAKRNTEKGPGKNLKLSIHVSTIRNRIGPT